MALEKIQLIAQPASEQELRLDQYLARALPPFRGQALSRAKIRQLIVLGGVYVNRRRVRRASTPVQSGDKIEVVFDPARLWSSQSQPKAVFQDSDILFEDADFIFVNKPAGIPSQPTLDDARDNLWTALKKHLEKRPGGPGYVGLHHRLDHDTSGVMVFTKSKRANKPLADLFREHGVQKTYLALAPNTEKLNAGHTWIIQNHLGQDRSQKKRLKMKSVLSGGQLAVTKLEVLLSQPTALLIQAQPQTGRTHQIRVHLSEAGYPILGDFLYGPTERKAPRVMLHAAALEFLHPFQKTSLRIEAPIPKDFLELMESLGLSSENLKRPKKEVKPRS